MPDERQLDLPEPERRLALVIGIDAAPSAQIAGLRDPLSATRDAEAVAQVLTGSCGFELLTSSPLLGEAATSAEVKRAVLQMARDRDEHDFLLLYFAGHGHLMEADGGQPDIFLVTHDFDEREVKAGLHFSMSWLRDQLYLSPNAGKILLILDCCYAGNMGRTAPDPYLEGLKARINTYFGAPGAESSSRPRGLRQTLAATTHNQLAYEQDGHGRFTALLLDALRGQVDEVIDLANHGYITLYLVQNYLQRVMPRTQRSSLSGDDAGKLCILAQNELRAEQLRVQKRATVNTRPQTYIPFQHNDSFQQRPGEFDTITKHLLPGSTERSPIVGLTGMGGTGKSQLAAELALLYAKEQRFPGGIFWLPVTEESEEALCYQLSELTANAEYLPADDDVSHPENRRRRARHLCRWLAEHPDALLILDNVQQIEQVLDLLPKFAGGELHCTILYTSRNPDRPPASVWSYEVKGLTEKGAWRLLLARREATLQQVLTGDQGAEAQAARAICNYVERLPLALTLLRDLLQDANLTVAHLWAEQQKRGTLALTSGDQDVLKARLFRTFEQSWNRVETAEAQRLFKLASVFPEAVPMPLWLLGIAANLPGSNTSLDALGRARIELQRWSMIEVLPNDMIRLHSLLREFGRYLLQQNAQDVRAFAETNLLATFTNINKLEERARAKDYWGCLSDVQEALNYARLLQIERLALLEHMASWLARESSLLGNSGWWPAQLPALFYQQLANRAVEESQTLTGDPPQAAWLRLTQPSDAESQPCLRELRHPDAVRSVAFSPDGKYILTACDDGTAYLWSADNGQIMRTFEGQHDMWLLQAVFSPGGNLIATCSADQTAIWDVNGQLLRVFHEDTSHMQSIAFSLDGKALAIASDEAIRVWNIDSGELIAYLTPPRSIIVDDATFSPDDSQIVACAGDGTVLVWDIASEQVIETIQLGNSYAKSAIFSSTGEFLFISLAEAGIVLWDRAHRQIVRRYANRYRGRGIPVAVQQIALAPNGHYLAASTDRDVAQVWYVQSSKRWCTYGHKDAVSDVAFSPDSTKLATASADHTVRIWEIPPVAIEQNIEPGEDTINLVQFSLDGTRMLTATREPSVRLRLWDVANGQMLYERSVDASISSGMTSIVLDHDGRRVIVAQPIAIIIYDIALDHIVTQFDVWTLDQWTSVRTLALSPDERLFAAGTNDGRLLVLDAQNWQHIATLSGHRNLPGHSDSVQSIAFSPDGRYIAAGIFGGEIHVWDTLQQYASVATLKGDIGLVVLAISPDKQLVAAGRLDGTLQLWSLQRKRQSFVTKKHTDAIEQLCFSPDGRLLVSSDRTGQVLLWRVQHDEITPAGIYITPSQIGAIHWQDARHLILADVGGIAGRPHFHHLTLEGFVEDAS